MMEFPVLSVFIPVFNAEKYLDRCLTSVLSQTFSDFELYIHDDGSRDNSYEICKKYAAADSRIILSTGENGHSVDEMNLFIDRSRGKYIAFVDNDDYLDLNYFEKMIQMLEKQDADCVISSYTLVDSEENILPWYTPNLEDGLVLTREETLRRFLTSLDIEGFRWNKIYKTSVFRDNKIKFPSFYPADINGEWILLCHINKAVLLDNHGYYYRQSSTSEVSTMSLERTASFLETFSRIAVLADEAGLMEEGAYYRTWRQINIMFNTCKDKKRTSLEEWDAFRQKCSWKNTVQYSVLNTLRVINSYKNPKESALKFTLKTVIVWLLYR